jgi:hypothetical protein
MKIQKTILFITLLSLFGCKGEKNNTITGDNNSKIDSIEVNDTLLKTDENIEEPEIHEFESRSSPAVIYKNDNLLYVYDDMHQDIRLFGYAKPDTMSQKMILYSIFTSDVEGNPFNCPFGAYYQTNGLRNGEIRVLSTKAPMFIKAEIHGINVADTISNVVYFLKDLIYIEEN